MTVMSYIGMWIKDEGPFADNIDFCPEMIYNPAEIGRYNNKYHIDFDPNSEHNDEMDILFFGSLLNKELRLRGLPLSGNMIDRQERLRQHLMIEERLDRI